MARLAKHATIFANASRFGGKSAAILEALLQFYGLPLDLCRKLVVARLAKRATIFANASRFGGKSAAILEALQSKDCGALQDGVLSGIEAHTGISAAHCTPR